MHAHEESSSFKWIKSEVLVKYLQTGPQYKLSIWLSMQALNTSFQYELSIQASSTSFHYKLSIQAYFKFEALTGSRTAAAPWFPSWYFVAPNVGESVACISFIHCLRLKKFGVYNNTFPLNIFLFPIIVPHIMMWGNDCMWGFTVRYRRVYGRSMVQRSTCRGNDFVLHGWVHVNNFMIAILFKEFVIILCCMKNDYNFISWIRVFYASFSFNSSFDKISEIKSFINSKH